MSANSRYESLYQWVVTPDEFEAGQAHAIPLEEIKQRAERAEELGVIRTAIKRETNFAVEFAPVTISNSSGAIYMQDTVSYSTMHLKWTNLTRRGEPYINTPPLSINQKGLIFNNDIRRWKRPKNISELNPNEVTGYLVDKEYAYAAAGVLSLAVAREFISAAEIHGIHIPQPGFIDSH